MRYSQAAIFITGLFLLVFSSEVFRFSNNYADHMVLQRRPQRVHIWGYGELNAEVRIILKNESYATHVKYGEL